MYPASSTVRPFSSAISMVRSIGKPYVSLSKNASAPPRTVFPDAITASIFSVRISIPLSIVFAKVSSSLFISFLM